MQASEAVLQQQHYQSPFTACEIGKLEKEIRKVGHWEQLVLPGFIKQIHA